MALSNAIVFEVRSTGSDTNGGGYKTGATGTDYSQQNAAQYALTGLTTAAANAIILSASAAADMVGNLIQITGGTNFITGIYEITSVSVGVSITVDRNCTSAAGVSGTANVGGAFATPAKAVASLTVEGQIAYIKATATYSVGTGITTAAGINSGLGIIRIIGYTTTRGDGGRATLQATAAINIFTDGQGGFRFENLILDGNANTGVLGFVLNNSASAIYNCVIKNFLASGVSLVGIGTSIVQSEVTGCVGSYSTGGISTNSTNSLIKNCYIHDNTTSGIGVINYGTHIIGNVIANNTGASSDGVQLNPAYSSSRCNVIGNVFYKNGRDGYRNTHTYVSCEISNNIFEQNVGIGLNTSIMSPVSSDILIHHNAYHGNGTARSGNNAGTGDVMLTGDPFTNAASNDFSLNNTAGAGAACRATGYPGVMIGGGTGYEDIGALRHQDPSAAGMLYIPNMEGT